MSEFESFIDLGEAFQRAAFAFTGKKRQQDGFFGFKASPKAGKGLQGELHQAGHNLQEHFRNKIINGGPGWAPLEEEWTQREREKNGFSPNDPLFADGQMYEAIKYEVHGLSVKLGIDTNKEHSYDGQPKRDVDMEVLFGAHETGYFNSLTGKWVDARPIFTHSDAKGKLQAVATNFGQRAIVNGFLENLAPRGRK